MPNERPKRPYYETNIRCEVGFEEGWYRGTITGLAFPSNPDSPTPDKPIQIDISIGNDDYKITVLRYDDDIIYGKVGVAKGSKRVMIVVQDVAE
jgi:hypothetical protein